VAKVFPSREQADPARAPRRRKREAGWLVAGGGSIRLLAIGADRGAITLFRIERCATPPGDGLRDRRFAGTMWG